MKKRFLTGVACAAMFALAGAAQAEIKQAVQ